MNDQTLEALAHLDGVIKSLDVAEKAIGNAIAEAQQAASVLQVMDPGGSVGNLKALSVPWIGQNVREINTDDFSNSDCGPACLAMVLAYRGRPVTVDQVSRATGLNAGYTYTLPAHLVASAKSFGLNLAREFFFDSDASKIAQRIKAHIDAGNPVIALVHYGSLQKRYDEKFKAGHWIVIVGYSDTRVVYNDPLWQDETGKALDMSWSGLMQAMADCKSDGNTAYQGLVII